MSLEADAVAEMHATFDGFFVRVVPAVPPPNPYNFKAHMSDPDRRVLSNFHKCKQPFVVRGLPFFTSEMAYQFFYRDSACSEQSHARWAAVEVDPLPFFTRAADVKCLLKHRGRGGWGISSKLLMSNARAKVRKTAGIVLRPRYRIPSDAHVELWLEILSAKFAPGTYEASVLLCTGDRYLVEMDQRCKPTEFWSGFVPPEGGSCRGMNFTGKLLMLVRSKLQ
jgi:hypothetical protein